MHKAHTHHDTCIWILRQNVWANDDERHLKFDITGKTISRTNPIYLTAIGFAMWIHICHGCLQRCVHKCVIVLHSQPKSVEHHEIAIWSCSLQLSVRQRHTGETNIGPKCSSVMCTIERWLLLEMHFSLAIHGKFTNSRHKVKLNLIWDDRVAMDGVFENLIEKSVCNLISISNSHPNATVKCLERPEIL